MARNYDKGKTSSYLKMKDVLLNEPALTDAEDDINHLDTIDHANCVYGDRPLTIDVDDLLSDDLKTKVAITLKKCKIIYPTGLGCSGIFQ